jgi:hypothetical protein
MSRAKLDKSNLRRHLYRFKISDNQAKRKGGLTQTKLKLKRLNEVFLKSDNKQDMINMLQNIKIFE